MVISASSSLVDGLARATYSCDGTRGTPPPQERISVDREEDGGAEDDVVARGELALVALRTLMSLTHENPAVGEILTEERAWCAEAFEGRCWCAAALLFEMLVRNAAAHDGVDGAGGVSSGQQGSYDVSLYCMNILTNATETNGRTGLVIFNVTVDRALLPRSDCGSSGVHSAGPVRSVSWLACWTVQHTENFRTDALKGSGDLAKGQEENLVMAGNAFVLLIWLMKRGENDGRWLSDKIRNLVFEATPTDKKGGKVLVLVVNTLKAF